MVEAIAENVEETEIHVEEGTRQLQQALNYKKTIYPILGGFIGACMLGPVGLVAGLKAGGAAGLCGGICGYAGEIFLLSFITKFYFLICFFRWEILKKSQFTE